MIYGNKTKLQICSNFLKVTSCIMYHDNMGAVQNMQVHLVFSLMAITNEPFETGA
jgi:hypothetical protein